MITQQVRLGAETITVQASNLQELAASVGEYRLMHYRLNGVSDAVLRFRKNSGGDFLEFVSRKLKATKQVSKELEKPENLYIGADTPWVRFDPETEKTYVRYDADLERTKNGDALKSFGWTEDDMGVFVEAVRCKSEGKKGVVRQWTYAPVRD